MSTTAKPPVETDKPSAASDVDSDKGQQRPHRLPHPEKVDKQSQIIWTYMLGVIIFHLLIPVAFLPYFFSWWGLLWLPIGNYLFCSVGIGAGYHRCLTHRGFKCHPWFEHLLAILGVCNLQDSPARWVLVHRIHHQHSDERPDPHSPMVSFFWGHVGWLFIENRALSTPDIYQKYVRDILSDPFYMRLERKGNAFTVYFIHAALFYIVGLIVGWLLTWTVAGSIQVGLQWLMWGVIMRTVYTWHVTWGVNSFSHLLGYQTYKTRDNSRNNWFFGLATNGEGWHNNHHADPRSAQHGHRWWEIDVTYRTIRLWEKLGLVWDVVEPNRSRLDQRASKLA